MRPSVAATMSSLLLCDMMQVSTDEGVWIQLNASSVQSYCHDQSGDAWCMVSSCNGDVFLRTQADSTAGGAEPLPFSSHTSPTAKAFDFTKASKTPTFSPFATTALPGKAASVCHSSSSSSAFVVRLLHAERRCIPRVTYYKNQNANVC